MRRLGEILGTLIIAVAVALLLWGVVALENDYGARCRAQGGAAIYGYGRWSCIAAREIP